MAKKSKRGSGPRPGSNRAERVAARKERQAGSAVPRRPFAGLAAECDLVAMRAFVASATARLALIEPGPPEPELTSVVPDDEPGPALQADGVRNHVNVATVLPGAVGAMVRDGKGAREGFAALQVDPEPTDIPAALAAAVEWAAHAGSDEQYPADTATDKTLADLLVADAPLDITVHEDFSWWYAPGAKLDAGVAEMLARAATTIMPTARMTPASGLGAPWWVNASVRAHLRWVRPEDEDTVMKALARLHAAGHLTLGEGSRYAGSFRTHGLLVPVFDLDVDKHADEWYDGLNEFDSRLVEAMADPSELTTEQLRSRDGIRTRQVTLRV